MKSLLHKLLRRRGYLAASEVRDLLDRLCQRVDEFDEPMAREFVLNPYPGGIERRIRQLCQRRRATSRGWLMRN